MPSQLKPKPHLWLPECLGLAPGEVYVLRPVWPTEKRKVYPDDSDRKGLTVSIALWSLR